MQKIVVIAALAALLALPGAGAVIGTSDQIAVLDQVLPPEAQGLGEGAPAFYIDDAGNLWMESNGLEGLQTEPVVDEETGETVADPDSFVFGFNSIPMPF